ncbi:MAG: response regulator transcription factor [Deltaproteobacteria bacterium]|nr:response regulator transcription factor [Deltaproteobacteria bacterium]
MACRVGIVEDHAEMRAAIAAAVMLAPDREIAFAVGSAEEALVELANRPADLVFVDLGLPGMDGIDLLRRLPAACPGVEAIVLTVLADEATIFEALRAGAVGYLMKDSGPARVSAAIDELRAGGAPMTPGIARRVVDALGGRSSPPADPVLSHRELEILRLLAHGYTYQNVAARLGLSGHTIHSHLRNVYRKLQVNSRSEAVWEAVRRRLLQLE